MSKVWYPVVDYSKCAECGACIRMCPHGVYDVKKYSSPVVSNPDDCISGCHNCANKCPNGAITYVGDRTGWIPPHGKPESDVPCCERGCSCDCGCEEPASTEKKLVIDFLYLDLKVCERCIGTDTVLTDAVGEVAGVLKSAGFSVYVNKIEIIDEKLAEKYKFLSSPTIRINNRDICLEVKENLCGSCSDLGSYPTDCRLFVYEGKEYEVPPKAMIINAILNTVYNREQEQIKNEPYAVPENLKDFFKGKYNNNSGLCCGGGNCC